MDQRIVPPNMPHVAIGKELIRKGNVYKLASLIQEPENQNMFYRSIADISMYRDAILVCEETEGVNLDVVYSNVYNLMARDTDRSERMIEDLEREIERTRARIRENTALLNELRQHVVLVDPDPFVGNQE